MTTPNRRDVDVNVRGVRRLVSEFEETRAIPDDDLACGVRRGLPPFFSQRQVAIATRLFAGLVAAGFVYVAGWAMVRISLEILTLTVIGLGLLAAWWIVYSALRRWVY